MRYQVNADRQVEKFLARLRDVSLRNRIVAVLRGLESDPRPVGCVKLSGSVDLFRLRVGEYRIIYQVRDAVLTVLVIEIGHRREVYR